MSRSRRRYGRVYSYNGIITFGHWRVEREMGGPLEFCMITALRKLGMRPLRIDTCMRPLHHGQCTLLFNSSANLSSSSPLLRVSSSYPWFQYLGCRVFACSRRPPLSSQP